MKSNRVSSLVFLLAFNAGLAEPHLGVARDGEVHHEDAMAAVTHSEKSGDHGHEDAGNTQHEHGDEHQHGTGGDHCTHVHSSVEVQQSMVLRLPADVESSDFPDPMTVTQYAAHPPIRPPIA